jgi:hypothetical protein
VIGIISARLFQSPFRTYYLYAESREELDRWLCALEATGVVDDPTLRGGDATAGG